jgi:hypothetical protein
VQKEKRMEYNPKIKRLKYFVLSSIGQRIVHANFIIKNNTDDRFNRYTVNVTFMGK